MISIDFDQASKEYEEQLINKLRDFGSDALKQWIPEENIVLSILNLCFSIVLSNEKSFKIIVNVTNFIDDELKILENYMQKFSQLNIENYDNKFTFVLKNVNEKRLEEILNNYFKDNQLLKSQINSKIDKFYEKTKSINIKQLKELYYKKDHTYKNLINAKDFEKKQFEYIGSFGEDSLGINLKDQKIITANYSNFNNQIESFFLDNFCNIILNLPLYEAYEHGVIKLEYCLRTNIIQNSIKGIISPLSTRGLFLNCHKLIKSIWMDYSKKKDLSEKYNFYDISSAKFWSQLNNDQKIVKLNEILRKYETDNNLSNIFLIESFKFNKILTLSIKNPNLHENKSIILLDLERYIRQNIDKRIEVFYIELLDFNKLRIKNSPQNISQDI